ncbi:MAG: DUF2764 family protein [Bacteroidota bacterium]
MNYYYLISGLPDLEPTTDVSKIDAFETIDTIQRNLEPVDYLQFKYLLYPRDNRNLLNRLCQKYHNFPQQPYLRPVSVAQEVMDDYRTNRSMLPSYMSEFLSLYEDQFTSMVPRDMENKLEYRFYDQLKRQSLFIKEYYEFEKTLKEILAAYNASYYDFLPSPDLADNAVFNQLGKGKGTSSEMIRQYPFIESIIEKFETKKPIELENFITQIKWDYLSETRSGFSSEQVFAYTLKLLLVIDINVRDADQGKSRFKTLQQSIKSNVDSPLISSV